MFVSFWILLDKIHRMNQVVRDQLKSLLLHEILKAVVVGEVGLDGIFESHQEIVCSLAVDDQWREGIEGLMDSFPWKSNIVLTLYIDTKIEFVNKSSK